MHKTGNLKDASRADWIEVAANNSYANIKKLLSSVDTQGRASGLHVKFDDWKDNRWMPGTPAEGRGVRESAPETFDSSMRSVKAEKLDLEAREMALMSKSISEPEPKLMMSKSDGTTPMVRADSGSGGGGHSCFVAGTQVLLPDGKSKSIEEMEKGDLVVSYNEETGENQISEVEETMAHRVDEDIYTLYIEGDTLDVTGIHKFWIMRGATKSWIPASDLVVGDLVMFSDRSLHPISKIDVEKLSTGVFNIEVSKNHNYYVGRNGVLAHNKDCFLAGTMVLLPDGRKIAIEMVKKGDFVVSYNLVTGTNQKSVVLETMRHLVEREIFTIKVSEDQIRATGVHKFYVNRNGSVDWIPAEELVVGDFVMLSNGNWNAIESIEMEVQLTRVYNLHVSDNHNYYVGENSILVHNKGDSGDSGGTWHTSHITETYTFHKWTKKLAVHTGVPAWKQEVDESHKYESDVVESGGKFFKMHFGEVTSDESTKYNWYFLNDDQPEPNQWNNPFRNKFNFFTNNLCGSDKTNYAWPFYYSPSSTFKSIDIDEDNNQKTK